MSIPVGSAAPAAATWGLAALVRQAGLTWVTRAGLRFLLIADVLIVGRHATSQLAPVGIAYAVAGVLYVLSFGLLLGCLVRTAAAAAGPRPQDAGAVLGDSLVFSVLAGGLALLACQFGEPVLLGFGQSAAVSADGGRLLAVLGLGIPFHFVFVSGAFFLEALGRGGAAAALTALAFALNCGLSLAVGAAALLPEADAALWIAGITVALRAAMAVAVLSLICRLPDRRALGLRLRWPRWSCGRGLRRIGFAAGASIAVESASIASLSIFAGWLGDAALAAYTVLNNLVSLMFSLALAIGVVTGAQVAAGAVRGARPGALLAFRSGIMAVLALMAVLGSATYLGRDILVALATADVGVAGLALPLVIMVSVLVLADGGQTVVNHALRGLGDTWPATLIHLACYLLLMTGGGWLLGIAWQRGLVGLLEAATLASFAAMVILTVRFFVLARRLPAGAVMTAPG